MAAAAELPLIRGADHSERHQRQWLAQAEVAPELALHDFLPCTSRLVVVAPHPGDEVLACGGLLSMHAERGGQVLLVAVTDGEASCRGSTRWTRSELGSLRSAERLQGLQRLGLPLPDIAHLALPDGQVAEHMARLRSGLLAVLQPGDVVVGTWPHDGHPDHEATGRVARIACRAVGSSFIAAPLWMWHWAAPADPRVPWRLLRALPLSAALVAQKLSALSEHRSRFGARDVGAGPVLGSAIRSRAAWPAEYYFRTPGAAEHARSASSFVAAAQASRTNDAQKGRSMWKAVALRWWTITRDALTLWLDHNAFSHAGSLAFYTLFSMAPVVIIAVSVIGVVLGEQAAQGQIGAQIQAVMGHEAALAIEQAVARSRIEEAGLLPTLLGVAALIVGATSVFAQMQFSLNTIWGVAAQPTRNSILMWIKSRLLSLTVVLAIGFVLLVSLLLGVVVRAVLHFTHQFVPAVAALLSGAELLVSWLTISLLFAAIYKVLPDVVLQWRDVVVGALVTAVLFSIGRHGIAVYLTYTAPASTYGAAGSVVLILLWVYYSSLILLFGAAFTKTQLLARGRSVMPRNSAVRVRHELITEA